MSQKNRDPNDLNTHVEHLAQLLCIGGTQIAILAKGDQKIILQAWSEAVKKATIPPGTTPSDEQLAWLWEALTTEPGLREFGAQIRFLEDDWKDKPTVTVLSSGHTLGVFLKGLSAFGAPVLSVRGNVQPDAMITLLGPLTMGPGKARRFECRDVNASVMIRVNKPGSAQPLKRNYLGVNQDGALYCLHEPRPNVKRQSRAGKAFRKLEQGKLLSNQTRTVVSQYPTSTWDHFRAFEKLPLGHGEAVDAKILI